MAILLLSSLTPVLLLVVVAVAIAGAGRSTCPALRPEVVFYTALTFISLVVVVASLGVAAHSASRLVGPTPRGVSYAYNAPALGVGPGGRIIPGPGASGFAPVLHGVSTDRDAQRNRDTVRLVWAGFFFLAASFLHFLVWPKARAMLIAEDRPDVRFPTGYAYFVAGTAAVAALVFAPLAASGCSALAPGVNNTTGHAGGVRAAVTWLVLLVAAGVIGWSHLQLARSLVAPEAAGPEEPPDVD